MPRSSILSISFRLFLLFMLLFSACSKTTPTTTDGCKSDDDCKMSARCGAETKKCVPIICESDKDCRGGWHCNLDKERCQKEPYDKPECEKDSDCSQNEKCELGSCVKKGCQQDSDCPSSKPICKNGQCIEGQKEECQTNADCKDPQKPVCKEHKCIPKPQVECEKDTDCLDPTKPECHEGKCVEHQDECTKNDDCPQERPLCVARQCVADTGAKEGEACEDGVTDCKSKLICYDPKGSKKGICRLACLVFNARCPSPKVCHQIQGNTGVCLDPNNGKLEGEDCSNDACELNLSCVTWKKKKVCATPCDPNNASQCGFKQECLKVIPNSPNYYCVAEREPCGPGRPCSDKDEICENGKCNPKKPCQPACSKDQICDNGKCRAKTCPNEMQCTPPQVCKNGTCVDPAADAPCTPCSSTGTCPRAGDICLGGLGGFSDRFCFSDCSNGKACPDPKNFSCRILALSYSRSCNSNSDCNGLKDARCINNKCTRTGVHLCIPIIGTCKNRCKTVKCPAGKTCDPASGQCFVTKKKACDPCTSNFECGGPNDLCLQANGKRFCGVDCSSGQSCPSNFVCVSLTSGAKQCVPPPPSYSCP